MCYLTSWNTIVRQKKVKAYSLYRGALTSISKDDTIKQKEIARKLIWGESFIPFVVNGWVVVCQWRVFICLSLPSSYPILLRPLCRRGGYFARPVSMGIASVLVWISHYLLTSALWSYDFCVVCVPLVRHFPNWYLNIFITLFVKLRNKLIQWINIGWIWKRRKWRIGFLSKRLEISSWNPALICG